jgi:hypothetical protein
VHARRRRRRLRWRQMETDGLGTRRAVLSHRPTVQV